MDDVHVAAVAAVAVIHVGHIQSFLQEYPSQRYGDDDAAVADRETSHLRWDNGQRAASNVGSLNLRKAFSRGRALRLSLADTGLKE